MENVSNVLKWIAQKRRDQRSQSSHTPKAQCQPAAVPRSHHLSDPGRKKFASSEETKLKVLKGTFILEKKRKEEQNKTKHGKFMGF